jgi:D-alanine-D-alanine ligase
MKVGTSSAVARSLRIGLAFNQRPAAPIAGQPRDLYAEWDDPITIAAVESALAAAGEVVRLEAIDDFPQRLYHARPDIVFNMAEGLTGPNREAHVPSFCEFWNIPCTGSDPLTLSLCTDKGRTKEILAHHRIPTPEFAVVRDTGDPGCLPPLPVIVKPVQEGSSKGITQASFCRTMADLTSAAAAILDTYGQPAIVERWLGGREFTCAVLGNGDRARILPIVEIDFSVLPGDAVPLYSYEAKWEWDTAEKPLDIHRCPASIDGRLARRIEETVLASYRVLGCRDWARIDVRCDEADEPHILEVNPLPGIIGDPKLSSCFPTAARAAGLSYDDMVLAVLEAAIERYGIGAQR